MNTNAINEVSIRRANTLYVEGKRKDEAGITEAMLATLQAETLRYGYAFSPALLEEVSHLSNKSFKGFCRETLAILGNLSGHSRSNLEAFYVNFPEQVLSEAEYYLNAQAHYFGSAITDLTGGVFSVRILPDYEKTPREEAIEADFSKATVLELAKETPLGAGLAILNSPMSVSTEDLVDVSVLVEDVFDNFVTLFVTIADTMNHENLVLGLSLIKENIPSEEFPAVFENSVNTATDVLRYAILSSGGDVSLANNYETRFKSFPRKERRMMLSALNSMKYEALMGDFARHESAWKRVVRVLHPGESKSAFPNAYEAFHALNNGMLFPTFAAQFDVLAKSNDIEGLTELLSERPGEFARRLNHVLTLAEDKTQQKFVVSEFRKVASKVPSVTLWQMLPLFENRNTDENRVIYPKGNVSRGQIVPMPKKAYSNKIAEKVTDVILEAVMSVYTTKDALSKVWVDPELANFTIPTGLRSASKARNAIGRGSRVTLSGKKTERFFIWWIENQESGRLDVDLSATLMDAEFKTVEFVNYSNMGRQSNDCLHSGDYTSAPKGAAEYIDVDVESLLARGVKYIAMVVQVYSHQKFSAFECHAGLMGRENARAGEQFDARTVDRSFEISTDEASLVPMVIDLENREIVWGDVAGTASHYLENVNGKLSQLESISKGIVEKRYANLYQLFVAHAYARGTVVEKRKQADVVFEIENSVPNVTLDEIVSQFI